RDVQIDPHPVWRDFEFEVAPRLRRVRLEENFSNVAVPQFVAAAAGIAIGEDGDGTVAAAIFQKEKSRCPKRSNDRLAQFVRILTLPIGGTKKRRRALAIFLRREAVRIEWQCDLRRHNRICGVYGLFHAENSIT